MLKNSNFNTMHTPSDWIQSVLNYQKRDKEELELLNIEKDSAPLAICKKRNIYKVCIIAAAMIVLSCGCVLGYNILAKNEYYSRSRSSYSMFTNAPKDQIQNVNQSITVDNLKLTLTRITSKDNCVAFEVVATKTDGSDLIDFKTSDTTLLSNSKFKNINILIDGASDSSQNVYKKSFRTDDESNTKQAIYEIRYKSDTSLAGKNISLQLTNLVDSWLEPTSIGITNQSLYDIFDGIKLADSSTFRKNDLSNAKSSTAYYVPPVGDMHIPISSKYPDCYIDNAGFGECVILDKTYACFYMAITVTSDEEYNAFMQTVAYNIISNEIPSVILNSSTKIKIEGNRIIMALVPGREDYWSLMENMTDPAKIDQSFLTKYCLTSLPTSSMKGSTLQKGTWSFDLTVNNKIFGTEQKTQE
jgi:hypothetical protein